MRWITVCSIHDLSLTILFVMNFDLDCSQALIGFVYLPSSSINYSQTQAQTQIVLSIKFLFHPGSCSFSACDKKARGVVTNGN